MNTSDLDLATLGGYTMGTTWSVKLAAPRRLDLHPLHTAIQTRLDQIVAEMSTWEPNSTISRFNRAPAGSWHVLPNDFDLVLRTALDIATTSNGAFDPTVGPLVTLWGFGAHGGNHQHIPMPEAIALATTRVGWQRLVRTTDGRWLQPGGIELDLSAIAKGYGVDAVAATLHTQGVKHALVDIGGELYGYGHKPDGTPWSVLVEPDLTDKANHALPPCILELDGLAVATSGDRWHHFEHEGQRYTHTINPQRGTPLPHAPAMVTMIAVSAMHADAWTTALSVLGRKAGLALAEALGLAVRYLEHDNGALTAYYSPAFTRLLHKPSTA
ncbi:MAG TPA: FAD:protein FMN transferase [Xylella taiwanensis]